MAQTTAHKYLIACPPECSLHPDKIGEANAKALLNLKEMGYGATLFARDAEVFLHRRVPSTSASRHLKHYREISPDEPEQDILPGATKRVTDLEILDDIIAAGARNSRAWKPTIKDTLDAMKLKLQMTGASAFEDMLALMDSALDLAEVDDEAVVEAPESPLALGLPDEQPEVEEELAEPLIG